MNVKLMNLPLHLTYHMYELGNICTDLLIIVTM